MTAFHDLTPEQRELYRSRHRIKQRQHRKALREAGNAFGDNDTSVDAMYLSTTMPHYTGLALKRAGVKMSPAMLEELLFMERAFKNIAQRLNKLEAANRKPRHVTL